MKSTTRRRQPASGSNPNKAKPLPLMMLASVSTLMPAAFAQTPSDEAKELATVHVQANADRVEDGVLATATRVGKVRQDPHKIPQAVTTVTKALLDQQQASSLRDAMRNVSGLSFNAAEGGRSGDNMNLRGFYTFGDMYLDGIRDTAQYNRETFNLEQIDVLRGAGAMLFGRGQAGGVINQVSKTPLRYDQYALTGTVGSYGFFEEKADLNKVFSADTALRVNLMNRDEGSWRSNPADGAKPEIHRQGAALSLALNQTGDSKFWLNYYRLRTRDNPDYGIPFNSSTAAPSTRFPSSYFWGTSRTFDVSDTQMTTLINEYKLSPNSQIRTQLRFADYDRSYWAIAPSASTAPSATGTSGNSNKTRAAHYATTTLQSDYSTKFDLAGMQHEFLAGVEYLKESSRRNSLKDFGAGTSIPDYRPYQESTAAAATFSSNSYAIYLQDTIEFVPQWKVTAGIRHDWMDANYSSATSPRLKYGENSYRSALSWHPADDTHYYFAWSDSFSPTADLYQLTTTPLPAERSSVIELGAKWLVDEGNWALRAALYQATKNWERNADLEATSAPVLTKKRRTNGLELEAAGRITERWEIFSGLSLMDARMLEVAPNANPIFAGKRARNAPPVTFNLWTTYQLTSRWKIGGGVEAKAHRVAVNPASANAPAPHGYYEPNMAPGYARWDAMVAYDEKNWSAQLNLKNAFNQLYYDAIYDNGGFTVPGIRRSIFLTFNYKL